MTCCLQFDMIWFDEVIGDDDDIDRQTELTGVRTRHTNERRSPVVNDLDLLSMKLFSELMFEAKRECAQ